MAIRFEPLSKEHDRAGFRSASEALNKYLRELARKDAERGVGVAFVMIDDGSPKTIIGYYTLSSFSVELTSLPETLQKKLPRYPSVPATMLGRLARDERNPGTGVTLLMDALVRAYQNSKNVASFAIVADAKDQKAVEFYLRHDFQILTPAAEGKMARVFIAMATVAALIERS